MPRLTVPYFFTHDFVRKRHRKTEHRWDRGVIELDVAEVPRDRVSAVARIAVDKKYGGASAKRNFGFKSDGGLREMIWHDNECWIEFGRFDEFAAETLAGTEDPEGTPLQGVGHRPKVSEFKPFEEAAFVADVGPLISRTSTKERVESRLAERAQDLIVVDGTVYRKFREPYLTASGYLGRMLEGERVEYDLAGLTREVRLEGVNSYLPLSAQCRRLDRTGGLKLAGVHAVVLDPSRLYEMPERRLGVAAAHHILSDLLRDMGELPVSALDAAYALRDALTATPRQLSTGVVSALENVRDLPDPDPAWIAKNERVYVSRDLSGSYTRQKPATLAELLSGLYERIRARAAQAVEIAASLDPSECSDASVGSFTTVRSEDDRYVLNEVTSRDERRDIARAIGCDPDEIEAMADRGRIVMVENAQRHLGPDNRSTLLGAALIDEDGVEVLFSRDFENWSADRALELVDDYAAAIAAPAPRPLQPGARP